MSLHGRVLAAGGEGGRRTVASVLGDRMESGARLRREVNERISSDVLSELVRNHPQQARNEIRGVCEQVFALPQWSVCDDAMREMLVEDLLDSVFGLGIIQPLMDDPSVTEVMVNATDSVYYEKEGRLVRGDVAFSDASQIMMLVDRIVSTVGRRVDESSPMVDARLPDGCRVNVVVPPVAVDGPVVTIRKFGDDVMGLRDMEASGSLDETVSTLLRWMVHARCNVAVSGGTGCGKTTLLNALSCEISPSERVVTIEDSAELRFAGHPHVVRLEARPGNAEGIGEVSIRDLVANALRMRPDRIIVGECRGAEALDMLQAMNTGHDGSLTTLHANSPHDLVMRLATMVRFGADLPVDVIESNIASAIDVVVQLARASDGRRYVCAIAELGSGGEGRPCVVRELYARGPVGAGRWLGEPVWVESLPEQGIAESEEVKRWRKQCSCACA